MISVSDCAICGNLSETSHLELYVIGSEGIEICLACRVQITRYAECLMLENLRKRKEIFKARKAEENAR